MQANLDTRESNFIFVVKKIIHDLISPVSALKVICECSTSLAEVDRKSLEYSTNRIDKIIESFYKKAREHENSLINVQDAIIQIISEKRLEYCKSDLELNYSSNGLTADATIKGNITDFQRMLSNLFNNAADACSGKSGVISISIWRNSRMLYLTISDNGCGIPDSVLQKLRNGHSITYGKDNGHGIGFTQIRETIANLNGTLDISSIPGVGSEISIRLELS